MSEPFQSGSLSGGIRWLILCGSMLAAVVAGSHYGHEQWAAAAVIGVFVVIAGFIPYLRLALLLRKFDRLNKLTFPYLSNILNDQRRDLAGMDAAGEGTALGMCVFASRRIDSMPWAEACGIYLVDLMQLFKPKLDAVKTAAEQAPVLGFSASLFGMVLGVRELATVQAAKFDLSSLYAAMEIMLTSSLVGASAAFVCIGLSTILQRACEKHIEDLRKLASGGKGGSQSKNDDPDVLF